MSADRQAEYAALTDAELALCLRQLWSGYLFQWPHPRERLEFDAALMDAWRACNERGRADLYYAAKHEVEEAEADERAASRDRAGLLQRVLRGTT